MQIERYSGPQSDYFRWQVRGPSRIRYCGSLAGAVWFWLANI